MKKVLNHSKISNKKIIEKRYHILIILIFIIMTILIMNLFYIQIINEDEYKIKLKELQIKIVEGNTAPRGYIFDRNGNILVNNKPVKEIIYSKEKNITTKEEIEIAYSLAEILDINYNVTDKILKNFWLKQNSKTALSKITENEWNLLEQRKITSSEIEKLKIERITEEEILSFSDIDRKAAYIYHLMNQGYSYETKVIKKNATDLEYSKVASLSKKLKGINVILDWDRSYPYGDLFRSVLGNISSSDTGIPYDLKDEFLSNGYALNDRVGISYLEYQYDSYLKGEKDKYEIKYNGEKKLYKEGKRGNNLYLTIDINLQKEVEKIMEEEMKKAKEEKNTEYYNKSFVIVSDPNNGEILAMAGKQIIKQNDNYVFYDYTPGIINSSYTSGSIVKGASQLVGYTYGGLEIGEKRNDTCVKIASTPLKCSWKQLGLLDDITALKHSSNTYQFYTAMKVANFNYVYNSGFKITNDAFQKYRNLFKEFGLGIKTEIDLPNETIGVPGKIESGGLLLDYVIGQYDTYTPIQLNQYMSAIATGKRIQPHLLKQVKDLNDNIIYNFETKILNDINVDQIYLDRVRLGLQAVLEYGGTGSGYISSFHHPAGKTGTSQSFLDTDLDGKIDTETVTTTFSGYAPYDNPKVVFTVVSPDVSHYGNNNDYQTYVNKKIAKKVSDKYFELYP